MNFVTFLENCQKVGEHPEDERSRLPSTWSSLRDSTCTTLPGHAQRLQGIVEAG